MKIQNEYGTIFISIEVFTSICGSVANNCFGVKGMASRNVQDGIVQLLRGENLSKGVKVSFKEPDNKVNVELHIVVEHGVNIPVISSSIMGEIRYVVTKLTGIAVGWIDVYIDSIMAGT